MHALLIRSGKRSATMPAIVLAGATIAVESVDSAEDALELVSTYPDLHDLLILDTLTMPTPLFAAIRLLRDRGICVPILILTRYSTAELRARALRNGADMVLPLPIDPAELCESALALVRRDNGFVSNVVQVGMIACDLSSRQFTVAGEPFAMGRKEAAILTVLLLRAGRPVAREVLAERLYAGADMQPQNANRCIDVFVFNLRRKLQTAGLSDAIETLRGFGWIMRRPSQVGAQ